MIAAGEVVERPGSAVKELVENSVDAGARSVTVEIQHGGMSYIRVTDDGCGMSPEDAETAFLRHATSKLRDEAGLEAISTLGFRGEALAAISAVSAVELLTRERGAGEGVSLTLEAGKLIESSPAGCPEGTTIIVRKLFYNTPARLKFMKKDSAEAANVANTVIRCAMAHPEVAFRFIKDGREEFRTPGDGSAESCVYMLLGRDFARGMLKVDCAAEGCSVRGFVTPPVNARGNRSAQFFFVNGRFIKSPLLQSALEQAYKNQLFTGRFPGCVLYIDIKFNELDVNVHPAKTEIKFLNEKKVFEAVHFAVKSALDARQEPPELRVGIREDNEEDLPQPPKPVIIHRADEPLPEKENPAEGSLIFRQSGVEYNNARPQRTIITRYAPVEEPVAPPHLTPRPDGKKRESEPPLAETKAAEEEPQRAEEPAPPASIKPEESAPQETLFTEAKAPSEEAAAPEADEAPDAPKAPPYRIIGEAFKSYIVAESNGELIFIDKHAAHERMIFDRLKAKNMEAMSQILLTSIIAEPDGEDKELLLENKAMLDELGFEIEDFGGRAVAVRRIPAGIDAVEVEPLLSELCHDIRYGSRPGALGVHDELLASISCKAAIKAGWDTAPAEWKPVVEAVLSGSVKYCPHGRPVTMVLSKSKLDRNFKRT
jgi:DNA mismatch repair protein MutL